MGFLKQINAKRREVPVVAAAFASPWQADRCSPFWLGFFASQKRGVRRPSPLPRCWKEGIVVANALILHPVVLDLRWRQRGRAATAARQDGAPASPGPPAPLGAPRFYGHPRPAGARSRLALVRAGGVEGGCCARGGGGGGARCWGTAEGLAAAEPPAWRWVLLLKRGQGGGLAVLQCFGLFYFILFIYF